MIRFDTESRELTLGVRNLIEFDAAPALRAEPHLALRARAGAGAHRRHQNETEEAGIGAEYRSERSILYRTERRGRRVCVQGRLDGLYREEGRLLEEGSACASRPAFSKMYFNNRTFPCKLLL
jgi:hypothetical protein